MSVTKLDLQNALEIAIDDESQSDENIKADEMYAIKDRFDQLFRKLIVEADEEGDEEDEDDKEDEKDE